MKITVLISASILAASALAQDMGPILNLPPCPRNCVLSTLAKAGQFGCGATDAKCLCRSAGYHQELEKCATTQCNSNEADLMRKVGRKFCEQAGVPLPGQKEISQTSSSSYKFTNFTSTSGLAPPSATITHPGYPYPLPSDHSSSHLGPIVTGSVKTVHSEPSPPSPPPLDNNLGCVPSTVRSGPQIQTSLVPTGRTSIVPIANPTSTVPFDGPILPIFTTSPKETWTTSGSESTRSKHSLTVSTSQSEEHGASIPIEPTHTTSTRSKHSLTVSTSQSEEHSASIPIEPTHSSTSSTSNPQLPTATTAAKPPQTTAPEASGTNTGTVARVHAYAFIVALFAAFF